MERELKFRLYYHDCEHNAIVYGTHKFEITDKRLHVMLASFECNTIKAFCQYTGLKDKNDKEIYEGDIIRFLNGATTSTESGMDCEEFNTDGAIFWDDEFAHWDVTHRIDVTREDVFTDMLSYEVVGNVYQNPELITKQIT